ncbi:MAG: F0F1 ATP synthase subunit B [Ignavibacteria bacterium]|nr:F0F1 ATP synthase subunit B [Ignavibacteria bacterium]
MPGFLELSPGLVIWTLINFSIFTYIIAKYGWKPLKQGLAAREEVIANAISSAERANTEAKQILAESKEKIAGAQQEMMQIVREGKIQAEAMIRKAAEESESVKQQKLAESAREIERQKEIAIKELRAEVSSLVIMATEKLLDRTMQSDDHKKMVDAYVNEISKN